MILNAFNHSTFRLNVLIYIICIFFLLTGGRFRIGDLAQAPAEAASEQGRWLV